MAQRWIVLIVLLGLFGICTDTVIGREGHIQPYKKNPRYWQYQGQPVLLLGGSKDDNLFQIPNLRRHLEEMAAVGANYIRNTMSSRKDGGFEIQPYRKLANGNYDLNQWNPEYWWRFEFLLKWTFREDIVVQIELWDRFDYSREHWKGNPWNPYENSNYTSKETGLARLYPKHPGSNEHPFFHTVPGMETYKKQYDAIRVHQERFVKKLLSYTLQYGHVLYCMNNETSGSPKWGQYWMDFIQREAGRRRVVVYTTDMFDHGFAPAKSAVIQKQIRTPEVYSFVDISQVNSRNFNEDHWDQLMWYHQHVRAHVRPLTNTKIYSAGETSWGSGTPVDGVERFWRNLISGCSSSRFHRPTSGIGLNDIAKASIKSARLLETHVRFWEVEPHMELLREREQDEAYIAARPGQAYVLFFTDGGSVGLNLQDAEGLFDVHWIQISKAEYGPKGQVSGNRIVPLTPPDQGPWVAALVRKRR
jgi:hypothetical protein